MGTKYLFIFCWLLGASVFGQDLKSTPAANSVIDFRPIGEQRVWTFVSRDSVLGRLISTVKEKKTINDRDGLTIQQELGIDMSKIGGMPLARISAERWFSLQGYYLGEETKLTAEDQTNELKLEVDEGRLTGYFTRGKEKVEQNIPWPADRFAFDSYFPDELELFFARHGLTVGTTFQDSTFSPQTMLMSPIAGSIENFIYTELYKGRFDSVYVIRLTQPEEYTLLITPDYRLLRMDFPGIRLRAYLDRVAKPQVPTAGAPVVPQRMTPLMLIMRLAHWAVYLILGTAILLFFVRRQYRPWPNWVGLVAGCVAYVIVIFVQFPIQEWMILHWIGPRIGTGGNVLALGAIPSLIAGLLQQALLLAVILLVARQYRPAKGKLPLIGAFVGAGFAIAEAFYQTAPGPLLSWQLFERSFMLLLHISAGYLIGYLMALGRGLMVGWILLVVANALVRYLPLLLPQRMVTVQTLHFVLAFVALIVAAVAILVGRMPIPADQPARTSTGQSAGNPLA